MTDIFFIVGVGRSGTTLLQNMMNSHPKIAFIPEINYPRRFLFNKNLKKTFDEDKRGFIQFLRDDKWFRRLDDKIIDSINFKKIDESNFEIDLYKQILALNCKLKNKSYAGDKDPRSIELITKMNKIIPNIRWIHIIRDPRDVLLSKIKADWSKNNSILKHIFAALVQLKYAKKWKRIFSDNFSELYYEDLIQNPEQALKKLFREFDLEFDPQMLTFTDSAMELVAKDEYSWKKEVFSPIKKDNHSKWEKELDNHSVALVEGLVEPAFNYYHYKKSEPYINPFLRFQLVLLKPIYIIFSNLYSWIKQL